MVLSTTAAGTINQTARGFSSFFTRSASEEAPTAFSWANSVTACGDLSKTTHWWPPLSSRRTMFAPILPRPIMPSCIGHSFFRTECASISSGQPEFVPHPYLPPPRGKGSLAWPRRAIILSFKFR